MTYNPSCGAFGQKIDLQKGNSMPQDAITGALAREFGLMKAKELGDKIGAKQIRPGSNEFEMNGIRVTIRCAKKSNSDVGVTYAMLKRVSLVIGAFENDSGGYDLISLDSGEYSRNMRDSKGQGKVGLVRRSTFLDKGKMLFKNL